MNEQQNEILLDLLTKKATYGLDPSEQTELDGFDAEASEFDFQSLEITAAAIGMVGIAVDEQLPAHLHARILADADAYFAAEEPAVESVWTRERNSGNDDQILSAKRETSFFGWFGWAVAAAACLALIINIGLTRFQTSEVAVKAPTATPTPEKLTPAQEYAQMMGAPTGMVKATWAAGNVKEMKQISGDVVWSDEKQVGYMRLRGLPANDARKETYQLWIFDKNQDKRTPIDGGTFDVNSDGEVVIPINAKLKAQGPSLFAITVEKPGGVVVSTREKVAALATVPKSET